MSKKILIFTLIMMCSFFSVSQINKVTELYRSKNIIKPFKNPLYRIFDICFEFSLKVPQNNYFFFLLKDSSFILITKDIYTPKVLFRKETGKYICRNNSMIFKSKNNTSLIFKYPFVLWKKNKNILFHYNKEQKPTLVFHRKKLSKKYLFLYNKIDSLKAKNPY